MKLFVYGTLRNAFEGSDAGELLKTNATYHGEAILYGAKLKIVSFFPGLVSTNARGDYIIGDIYEFTNTELLKTLDFYEGCYDPNALFYRIPCKVFQGVSGVTCECYRLNTELFDLDELEDVPDGDFLAYTNKIKSKSTFKKLLIKLVGWLIYY